MAIDPTAESRLCDRFHSRSQGWVRVGVRVGVKPGVSVWFRVRPDDDDHDNSHDDDEDETMTRRRRG